jgi:hypothetical protein
MADRVARPSGAASSAGRQTRRRVLPASGAGSGVRPDVARVQVVQVAVLEGEDWGECSFSRWARSTVRQARGAGG